METTTSPIKNSEPIRKWRRKLWGRAVALVVISEYTVWLIVVTNAGCVEKIAVVIDVSSVVSDVSAKDFVTTGREPIVFRSRISTVDVSTAVGEIADDVDSVSKISTPDVDWVSSSNSAVVWRVVTVVMGLDVISFVEVVVVETV